MMIFYNAFICGVVITPMFWGNWIASAILFVLVNILTFFFFRECEKTVEAQLYHAGYIPREKYIKELAKLKKILEDD